MPPTTLTFPASKRCGAADLEDAPKDSHDERGPADQDGVCDPGPCGATALTLAVAFSLRPMVENFVTGMGLVILKPFEVGNLVKRGLMMIYRIPKG